MRSTASAYLPKGVSPIKKVIEYMILSEVADIIVGIPEEKPQNGQIYEYYCIQPSHLQEFNQMNVVDMIYRSTVLSNSAFVKLNDILLKRLNPSNIYLLTRECPNTFISANMMIVRANDNIDAKYLASILENQGLPSLQHNTTRGTAIQTISKTELQNVKIPILPLEKQKNVGEIWLLGKEKQKLLKKLADEETKHIKALIDQLMSDGGTKNGDN